MKPKKPKRVSGTRFVRETSKPTVNIRLIPFNFSKTESCIVEVGEGYLKFYKYYLKKKRKKG